MTRISPSAGDPGSLLDSIKSIAANNTIGSRLASVTRLPDLDHQNYTWSVCGTLLISEVLVARSTFQSTRNTILLNPFLSPPPSAPPPSQLSFCYIRSTFKPAARTSGRNLSNFAFDLRSHLHPIITTRDKTRGRTTILSLLRRMMYIYPRLFEE